MQKVSGYSNQNERKEYREQNSILPDDLALHGFLRWWYRLTAITPRDNSIDEREKVRKSRFLSAIVLSLLLIFFLFIPGCWALPNKFVMVADLGMMPICVLSLVLNRAKQTRLAGLLLVIAFEAALIMVVLTTQPLDEPSIQQYELFVFGELLSVSLLGAGSVFFLALFNSAFITLSLLFQPQTTILAYDLHTQFWPMLLRPVGLELLVAGVTYLWVSNAMRYMSQSYQAQELALEQKEQATQAQIQLQQNIEQLSHAYADAANQKSFIPVPLQEYRKDLWAIIATYNALQMRLQHVHQTEQELRRTMDELQTLKQAIMYYSNGLDRKEIDIKHPVQTKTVLDLLLSAIRDLQR